MRKLLAILAVLAVPVVAGQPAGAQTAYGGEAVVRQFVTTMDIRPDRLAEQLSANLPAGTAPVELEADTYLLSYAGVTPPQPLLNFLTAQFEELQDGQLGLRRSLNVSLHLSPSGEGTAVRAMLVTPRTQSSDAAARAYHQEIFGAAFPQGAEVLVDGASGGGSGDLVLAVRQLPEVLAQLYQTSFERAGYQVSRQNMAGSVLILGEREAAASFVFVQPDPEGGARSLVVIRSLEED